MPGKTHHQLMIEGLVFDVRIGCRPNERLRPVKIAFDVAVDYPAPPKSCKTDKLEDADCYAGLCEEIQNLVKRHEYNLLEHLCFEVYKKLKGRIGKKARVFVRVAKVKPPVKELGRASFSYGDFSARF